MDIKHQHYRQTALMEREREREREREKRIDLICDYL